MTAVIEDVTFSLMIPDSNAVLTFVLGNLGYTSVASCEQLQDFPIDRVDDGPQDR